MRVKSVLSVFHHSSGLRTLWQGGWTDAKGILLAAAVALAARLVFVLFKQAPGFDEALYLMGGRNLFEGQGFTFQGAMEDVAFLPLYGVSTGVLYALGASVDVADRMVHLVFGVALVVVIYLVTRLFFSARAALYAALLAAVIPALGATVLYSGTHPVSLTMAMGALAVLIVSDRSSRPWLAVLAGVLLGLAYLARVDGLVFFMVFLALTLALAWLGGRGREKKWLVPLALFLGFLVVFIPFTAYIQVTKGEWLGGRVYDAFVGLSYVEDPDVSEIPNSAQPPHANTYTPSKQYGTAGTHGQDILSDNPEPFIIRVVKNVRAFPEAVSSFQVLPFFLFIPMGIGIWYCVNGPARSWRPLAWLVASMLPALAYIPFGIQYRYLVPFVPGGLVLVGAGLAALNIPSPIPIRKGVGRPFVANLILLTLVLSLFLASLTYLVFQRYQGTVPDRTAKELAEAMAADAREKGILFPTVVTSVSKVPLYAGPHFRWEQTFPPTNEAEAQQFFSQQGSVYWAVLASEGALLQALGDPEWLSLVASGKADNMRVFYVQQTEPKVRDPAAP